MKYEPKAELNQFSSETEFLMEPFTFIGPDDLGPNWDYVDAVIDCMSTLNEEDQKVLYAIFYDRTTYEELANNLNIRAKSHAWRKTRIAMERLKAKLLEHPAFQEMKDNP
jgi:DNA-directed RNA polymerase specialized sigma24 family protein